MPLEDPSWSAVHEQLRDSMQREIGIMREILGNMLQEELSLQLSDNNGLDQIRMERSLMVERLGVLRLARLHAAKKFEELTAAQEKEKALSVDASSCEILSLGEQILALTEKMNTQNCRNNLLFHQMKHLQPLPQPSKQSLPHTRVKVMNKGYDE